MTSLRKNYILSLITQTITVLSPLIVTPFVARRLLADNIGIYSFTESVVFIFGLFALLGSQTHGQREIAYCQGDRKKELQTFSEIFLTSSITSLIVLSGYIVFILLQTQYRIIYWIQVMELLSFHWDISWFYQGREDFKSLLYRNLLMKSLYIVLIFILIRDTGDLPMYVFLRTGSFLFGGAVLLWPVIFQCWKAKVKLNLSAVPGHLKKMIPLFIPQIAIQIYTVLDKTMIGVITQSPYQNGCYEEAMKVIRVMMNFVGAAAGVLMPRVASLHAAGDKEEIRKKMSSGIQFVIMITLPMVAGIAIVAPVFMPFFLGNGFDDSIVLLQVLAILLLVLGIGRIVGSCLLAVKAEKRYTINVCIGAAVNFLLNLFLIHYFLAKGAAWASVIAELTVTLLMLYCCRNYLNFSELVKKTVLYLFSAAAMFGCLMVVKNHLVCKPLWELLVSAVSGMAIYGGILLVFRDDMTLSVVRMIWKKRTVTDNNGVR